MRLQAAGTALAVFGRPPSFEVLAIRAVRLAKPYENGLDAALDVTVSAGELLEAVDEKAATAAVPGAVTGPPWAGVLPPRGGWQAEPGLPAPDALRAMVAAGVAEFRTRTQELAPEARTRAELDRIGREIWSRTVGGTALPVRAVHAAQSLGFLRPVAGAAEPALLSSGAWLRLRTPYGSIAVRRSGLGALGVSVR
ncbi:FAD-binding PCMH-type domain-containing protein OS=Streptomyces glaucescens OX=1907 GN=SGLAU_12230 PE=4 SV=1 [Streptomyces glaucescens]